MFLAVDTTDDRTAFKHWAGKHSEWSVRLAYDPAGVIEGDSVAATLYDGVVLPKLYVVGRDRSISAGFLGGELLSLDVLKSTVDRALTPVERPATAP